MGHLPRLAIAGVLLISLFAPSASVTADHGEPFANQHFERTWGRTDQPVHELDATRTWMWGPGPNTDAMTEPYQEAPGGEREVQYFDKSRMEINHEEFEPGSEEPQSIWAVTNGLLVVELMSGQMQVGDDTFEPREPAEVNVAGDADGTTGPTYAALNSLRTPASDRGVELITEIVDRNGDVGSDPGLADRGIATAHFDAVTQHNIAEPFWNFMNSTGTILENGQLTHGALFPNPFFATGRPIIEPYWANVPVGGEVQEVLLQCFERRCLTYTPENPEGWQVEAGNVGQHYYEWRYGDDNGNGVGVDEIRREVDQRIRDEVFDFQLVELDEDVVPTLVNIGEEETEGITLPAVGPDPDTAAVDLPLPAQRVQLRGDNVTTGVEKDPIQEELSRIVELPPEQNFIVGDCGATPPFSPSLQPVENCGSLTVISPEHGMVSGVLIHGVSGGNNFDLSFIEPVNSLLETRDHPGLHIVYHNDNTAGILFDDEEEQPEQDESPELFSSNDAVLMDEHETDFETQVTLDGDVEFYNSDPDTVWSRMESIFNATRLIYGLVEPLSDPSWRLDLSIKGMEVWVSGGPSETIGEDLIDELTDDDYFIINEVNDQEIHHFFAGYEVRSVRGGFLRGKASGVGTSSAFGDIGERNSSFNQAQSSQTLKFKWAVMAHETGHLFGAVHGESEDDGCAGGRLSRLCGSSLMSTGSIQPDDRSMFFASGNDDEMLDVLNSVLD